MEDKEKKYLVDGRWIKGETWIRNVEGETHQCLKYMDEFIHEFGVDKEGNEYMVCWTPSIKKI